MAVSAQKAPIVLVRISGPPCSRLFPKCQPLLVQFPLKLQYKYGAQLLFYGWTILT